jgi:branched-chain amino acid transport system substrate-binding protein
MLSAIKKTEFWEGNIMPHQASTSLVRLSRRRRVPGNRPCCTRHRAKRTDQDRLPAGADRPSSSTGVGINRGTSSPSRDQQCGGIKGRKIELISRDTQSDPTKAVNAVAELTQRQKVAMIFGPLNSGEALAATPLIARDKVPMLHPVLGRRADRRQEVPDVLPHRADQHPGRRGANYYVVDVLKLKKVAVISDTTGLRHGLGQHLRADAEGQGSPTVVYTNQVDAANPDLKPELLRMQSAGAQAIMPWSVNAGFLSRICNTRGAMAGMCRSSAKPRSARARPRPCSRSPSTGTRSTRTISAQAATPDGKLPARRQEFVDRPEEGQDRIRRHAAVVGGAGLGRRNDDGRYVQGRRHEGRRHRRLLEQGQGLAGHLRHRHLDAGAAQRLPRLEVVMCEVNSLKDGAFNLAPGYSS